MKAAWIVIGSFLGLALLVVLFWVGTYNGLVSNQEGVNEKWSQVQTNYQRRADLVPNLVATVKGVANFEKDTMIAVTEARARVGAMQVTKETLNDPKALKAFDEAQGKLSSALSRLMVVVEKYPDLKASENFKELQSQLEGTENRISVSRRDFNLAVKDYNVSIRRFPAAMVAGVHGFKEKAYFEAAVGSEKAPEVKF